MEQKNEKKYSFNQVIDMMTYSNHMYDLINSCKKMSDEELKAKEKDIREVISLYRLVVPQEIKDEFEHTQKEMKNLETHIFFIDRFQPFSTFNPK